MPGRADLTEEQRQELRRLWHRQAQEALAKRYEAAESEEEYA